MPVYNPLRSNVNKWYIGYYEYDISFRKDY